MKPGINLSVVPYRFHQIIDPLQVARAIEERRVTVAGLVSKPWASGFRIAFYGNFLWLGMVLDAYSFASYDLCIDLYT